MRKHFEENLFVSGHTACGGCGQSMAARIAINAAGKNTIVCNSTGCLEVFSTAAPMTSWGVPFIHSLFENSSAVASGVEAALRHQGKLDKVRVIAQAGDGGTGDIGLQAISGMLERWTDCLYICYDNEAYMNTGIQRSGLTPTYSNTTTSPTGSCSKGNPTPKKPLIDIMAAHHIPYAATATMGYPQDFQKKVKKAMEIRGPKYIQVLVPCPLGWRCAPDKTIELGKLAVQTGLYPIVEFENGKLVNAMKVAKPLPVLDYLKPQGRYAHIVKNPDLLAATQAIADKNMEFYGLK
jgi:pyruvate ferredoxin oxidoreductase beta subunit